MSESTNLQDRGRAESRNDHADDASDATAGTLLASQENTVEEVLPILPKGFVENTSEVYAEVASYDLLPPEKLREYWRVYTTTNRRLCDPTAKRLESFWWHVWGSKLRNLSGSTLAKLYENISTGPTFVPLRGPANRYEGPAPIFRLPEIAKDVEAPKHVEAPTGNTLPSQADLDNSSGNSEDKGHTHAVGADNHSINAQADGIETTQHGTDAENQTLPQARVKRLSSSSSRPPPAGSILRKPRPPLSEPRPTPRFTLPTGTPSDDEADDHASVGDTAGPSSLASGSGSANSGLTVEPSPSSTASSRSGPLKHGGLKQTRAKFTRKKPSVAAFSSKRKPYVSKRPASQISAASSDASSQQEMLRLQSPKSPYGEHPVEGGIEHIESLPPPPEKQAHSILSKNEKEKPRPKQQQQQNQQEESFLERTSSDTSDKQPAPSDVPPNPGHGALKPTILQNTSVSSTDAAPADVPRARPVQHSPSFAAAHRARGIPSPAGSYTLEMPVVSRETLGRPSGRLIRQMTLPQEIGHMAAPTSAARSFPTPSPPTEALAVPSPVRSLAGSFAAPVLSRSTSQDGSTFWARRAVEMASSPPGMGIVPIAAPSMVAARGVFLDAEGPDPLQMYATTGLSDHLDDDNDNDDDEREHSFHSDRGSFVYNDPNPVHRPRFTPTRPTPTPRIPFARTRSQLNIILDREKERLGEGTYASWKESRTGRDHPESSRERDHSAGP